MATKPKGKFRSVRKKTDDYTEAVVYTKPITTASQSADTSIGTTTGTRDYLRINGPLSHKRNPSQSVMVRLKRLDTLRLNQRIKVKDYGFGTIQFLGCVHFAQGLFVGVELDDANGKHDGSYHGKRYFTAKDKHGVLVKQHKVELLDIINVNNAEEQEEEEEQDDSLEEEKEQSQNDNINNINNINNIIINELTLKNKTLSDKMEEYFQTVDDLEIKISNIENENFELKEEKLHFENEMNTKIEELEEQLKQIRVQLNTKDQVLKKQISNHENTKNKYKKKITQHEALKQKEQDTQQLIFYGDDNKDEVISQLKQKERLYVNEKQQYIVEMDKVNIQCQQQINKAIQQWIFDYGEF